MSLLVIENGVVIGGPQTPYIRSLFNTYVGDQVGDKNTTGNHNSIVGTAALYYNTTGNYNSAVGTFALEMNTTGSFNSALGTQTLEQNTWGIENSAVGTAALYYNTTGNRNSAVGSNALLNLVGNYHNNVAFGRNAGRFQADGTTALATPSQSVYIGSGAMGFNNSDVNSIVIGYLAKGIGANTVVLGNDGITITALKGKVGIGITAPNANTLLDVVSTTKAVMFPRMTTAQRDAIDTPTEGMLIYNITTHVFNFYAAAAWGAI